MPKTKIQIKTIQFLNIYFSNRADFLDYINKNVHTFIFVNHKEIFIKKKCNPKYFHDISNKNQTPLIRCMLIDNTFTIRAYGKNAIKSLNLWYKLFKKTHKKLAQNKIISKEHFVFKKLKHPITYTSTNWIPFNECKLVHGYYVDANPKRESKVKLHLELQSRINGNLWTLLAALGIKYNKDLSYNFNLITYPNKYTKIIALKSKNNTSNKLENKIKYSFQITFETNYKLPSFFTLGQNVGYGNGVFIKKKSKTATNEISKTKQKSNTEKK